MRRYAAHGNDSIYVDLQKDYFLGSAYLAQARQMKRAHATVSVRNPAKKIEEVFKSNRLSFYVWSVYYKTNIFSFTARGFRKKGMSLYFPSQVLPEDIDHYLTHGTVIPGAQLFIYPMKTLTTAS